MEECEKIQQEHEDTYDESSVKCTENEELAKNYEESTDEKVDTEAVSAASVFDNSRDKVLELEQELARMRTLVTQKDDIASLYEREKKILEKEKCSLKRELEVAVKEKENAVMIYATKEKTVLDARKEKENIEKQLLDCKKENRIISTKYQLLNEEKSRLTNMLDEKYNEIKRLQRDSEKHKIDLGNLEMKVKWISVKLTQETEAKTIVEKRLHEVLQEKNEQLSEERLTGQQKMEQEAHVILLKHENEEKDRRFDILDKEYKQTVSKYKELQESFQKEQEEKSSIIAQLEEEKVQLESVQNSLSLELLNSAKLRTQLEDLRILQAQDIINKEEIASLIASKQELEQRAEDFKSDLKHLRAKEAELLSINKEMTEKIVELQNEILLQTSKMTAINAENDILLKEKNEYDAKYNEIAARLEEETRTKNEERQLLAKHLSEKTKLYEATKRKLENVLGDLEAVKNKHSQVIKELNREISKYKKQSESGLTRKNSSDQLTMQPPEMLSIRNQSDSETDSNNGHSSSLTLQEPSKKHLVDRILRLQQAATRQTEKIDFLENHTMSLVSELQKKSKLLHYYMLRDQAGALTSSRSDQNKTELAKYGGVMSAIYGGIKGNNQSMTLELSLEINRKLQAVLEDTLLKNITLKENLDVLGIEVDKLTRRLAQQSAQK